PTAAPGEPTSSAPAEPTTGAETPDEPAGPTTAPGVDFDRVEAPAPIEEAEVRFLESFPVQHRLDIVSGLPSGCAAFERIDVERDGTTFTVSVVNTVPAPDQQVACTMIYGMTENTVDLGSDLDAGTEYTVHVNDLTITFVAQ